ncbi:hypothetical protein LCGC14_0378140 [marine sediment metagenome]|uniref:Uncharacterized protein n=1 Tax=marine sediment metagenome TaxID=412755 RepID=A0A0F9VQF1_9ZZZZ
MSRSFRHNPSKHVDKYKDGNRYKDSDPIFEEYPGVLFDDTQLSTTNLVLANSAATGSLSVTKALSSKARKRADKQFRKQRRHDDRLA